MKKVLGHQTSDQLADILLYANPLVQPMALDRAPELVPRRQSLS
jgi:hypothetical protein